MLSSWRKRKALKEAAREEHARHESHCTSLCCTPCGRRTRVIGFMGEPAEADKMRDLGVREGALVTVLRDGETLLVGVDDTRVGIGRAAAMNVLCTPQS